MLLPAQFEVFLSLVSGVVLEFAQGTDAEDGAKTGMAALVLATGVPITLIILFACIRPDAADRAFAFGRQTLASKLVDKMKEVCTKMGLAALMDDASSADSAILAAPMDDTEADKSTAGAQPPLQAGQLDEALGGIEGKSAGTGNTDWDKIKHDLMTMSSAEALMAAIDDPAKHMTCVLKAMGIAKLKAKAGPHLASHELDWDVHIMPLLEKVDTVDELREAAADPRGFLSQLLASSECDQAEQGAITRLADQLLAGAQGKIAAGTELEGDVRE